jgi:hypothetical protein
MQATGVDTNLFDLERAAPADKVRVAVHIRRGDFAAPGPPSAIRGRFNESIPIEWYVATCRDLQRKIGEHLISFLLISDGTAEETAWFEREFRPYTTRHLRSTVCSDLLIMSQADLLVCSISSFSMTAAFLGESPYVWYTPQLTPVDGLLTIWGYEPSQKEPASPTKLAVDAVRRAGAPLGRRSVPVDMQGSVPDWLIESCLCARTRRDRHSDLLLYGACSG